MKTLLLQSKDLAALVQPRGLDAFLDHVIDLVRRRLTKLDPERCAVPPREGLAYRNPALGLIEWMPSRMEGEGAAIKMVAYHPDNPSQRGLPTILSSLLVFDTNSGHLVGLLDGTFPTALRTGAVSAIASEILARPASETLGIIGCGAQAVTQAHALSRVFPLKRIMGYDIDPTTAESFARRVAFLGIPVEVVTQAALPALVAASDILCTCTSTEPGTGPVFAHGPIQPHLHVNAVGSDFSQKFEVPLTLLRRATVIPDFPAQALKEGECQQLQAADIQLDLTTLVQNPARHTNLREDLTVFDSTGYALIDQIVAMTFLERARASGLGTEIELECIPADSKDPYSFLPHPLARSARSIPLEAR